MVAKFKPFIEEVIDCACRGGKGSESQNCSQNDAKRERALLKARGEASTREKLEAEIARLQLEHEEQLKAKSCEGKDV